MCSLSLSLSYRGYFISINQQNLIFTVYDTQQNVFGTHVFQRRHGESTNFIKCIILCSFQLKLKSQTKCNCRISAINWCSSPDPITSENSYSNFSYRCIVFKTESTSTHYVAEFFRINRRDAAYKIAGKKRHIFTISMTLTVHWCKIKGKNLQWTKGNKCESKKREMSCSLENVHMQQIWFRKQMWTRLC